MGFTRNEVTSVPRGLLHLGSILACARFAAAIGGPFLWHYPSARADWTLSSTLPHSGRWKMALMTLRAVTLGLGHQPSVSSYAFTTRDAVPCQIDGEVVHVPAGTQGLVESARGALATI